MQYPYVTFTSNAYKITNTRVSLDSIVLLSRDGFSPESILESYPSLSLEQVYGALAFYLGNRSQIDAYLLDGELQAQALHNASRVINSELIAKLQRARRIGESPSL
jgi:uncharacterized protein (DUF433 family)